MANRNPDTERRDNGTSGNGHHQTHGQDFGARDTDRTSERSGAGGMTGRSTAGSGTEPDTEPGRGGRYYAEAMRRGRESRTEGRGDLGDRLLGMGFARSGRGMRGGAEYAREDWHTEGRGAGRDMDRGMGHGMGHGVGHHGDRGYRTAHDRSGDTGYEGQTGGFAPPHLGTGEFEHRREGFGDFGTPSYTQGRELHGRGLSERDFGGRDDRVAGRSGMSYRPDQMETRTYRPPEEDWERSHARSHGAHRQDRDRPRFWEDESSTAEDIMTSHPKSVGPEANLREVAEIMRAENSGIVPVVNADRRLIGLITDRDMVMRTYETDRPWTQVRAREVMTDEIDAVTPDEPVREIIELMGRKQVRRVPVVDRNDRLLGIIAMADVANRADRDEELQHALDRVSKRRSFWRKLWS